MDEPAAKAAYRTAYEAWLEQLLQLHAFLLDGEALHPTKIKGLLNREARAKDRYDMARNDLLGIEDEAPEPA
jgi:hypothetical protein